MPFIESHMSEFLKFCFLTISLKQNFISHTELDSVKRCHEHSERALQCVRSKKPNGLRSNGFRRLCRMQLATTCRNNVAPEPLMLFYCFRAKLRPNWANKADTACALRFRCACCSYFEEKSCALKAHLCFVPKFAPFISIVFGRFALYVSLRWCVKAHRVFTVP